MDDCLNYNGKTTELGPMIQHVANGLRGSPNFSGAVLLPRYRDKPRHVPGTETLAEVLLDVPEVPPPFERLPFHDPALICYSSGTTGKPKCIVHCVGGIILNGYKEGVFHTGIGPEAVTLQYTTTGWVSQDMFFYY